jgi:hypothetical protein
VTIRPPCDEAAAFAEPPATLQIARGRWILAATILGSSMAFIDGTVVNVALPALQSALGATVSDVQWVVESYALMLASLLLVGGSLGDLYGRRKVFVSGVVLFAAGVVRVRGFDLFPDPGAGLTKLPAGSYKVVVEKHGRRLYQGRAHIGEVATEFNIRL